MARQSLKNRIIIGLLCTNAASAAYLLWAKAHRQGRSPAALAPPRPNFPPKQAQVQGGTLEESGVLQACYEDFLTRRPTVSEGVVQVHWTINNLGRIDSLDLIKTDMPDERFTGCLMDEIRRATFPAPKERVGVLISHRFKFKRKDASELRFE